MDKGHKVDSVLEQTLSKLKTIIDTDSVIGKPIKGEGGNTIIPISKVSMGFVAGGGEYSENTDIKKKKDKTTPSEFPFAGGSGGGFNITPVGFLIISGGGDVRLINFDKEGPLDKAYDVFSKIYSAHKKEE